MEVIVCAKAEKNECVNKHPSEQEGTGRLPSRGQPRRRRKEGSLAAGRGQGRNQRNHLGHVLPVFQLLHVHSLKSSQNSGRKCLHSRVTNEDTDLTKRLRSL